MRCQNPIASVALGIALGTLPASAQVIPPPDSARLAAASASAALVHWVASSSGAAEQTIFIKNSSDRPIDVTSYEIYECVNLAKSVCGVHTPGPRIAAGKTVSLQTIRQRDRRGEWSYQYRFTAAYVTADSAQP